MQNQGVAESIMENEIRQGNAGQDVIPGSIAELLEEIRMASLNLAVASAKFKAHNQRQDQIKKDLVVVVALALESVQFLSKFLDAIGIKANAKPFLMAEVDHDKAEYDLQKLSQYIERITENFLKDRESH